MTTATPRSARERRTATGPTPNAHIDPQTLMRIRGLEMRARLVVEGFMTGLHRSPYHGFSVEFTDYRQYTEGDDPRYLDWRLYARTDRLYIKRFEDETNLRCHLLVDMSRSMGYGSLPYTKADYATTLAATLAYFLAGQRDAVGLVTFAEQIGEYLPARYRPGHIRRLMLALEQPVEGRATDVVAPLQRLAELVTKRGLVVLISDLLAPIDRLESHLGGLVSQWHEVIVFHVFDPAELSFEFEQPALFEDVESGRQLYVDPSAARKTYLDGLAKHNEKVQSVCSKLGIDYHKLATDRPLDIALSDFLRAREHRRRTVRRSGAGRRRNRQ